MPYAAEPPFRHGQSGRAPATAVVLCNLGTPEAPTAPALRRYLAQFLADPRVVEIPRPLWWLILHGVILRVRPAKIGAPNTPASGLPEGSPLKVWTEQQTTLLRGYLGERGHRISVRHAMRYGSRRSPRCSTRCTPRASRRILVLPMYPQYSATTTASVFDAVYALGGEGTPHAGIPFVNRYHDHPAISRRWRVGSRPLGAATDGPTGW